jgi:hypothetical protein
MFSMNNTLEFVFLFVLIVLADFAKQIELCEVNYLS